MSNVSCAAYADLKMVSSRIQKMLSDSDLACSTSKNALVSEITTLVDLLDKHSR